MGLKRFSYSFPYTSTYHQLTRAVETVEEVLGRLGYQHVQRQVEDDSGGGHLLAGRLLDPHGDLSVELEVKRSRRTVTVDVTGREDDAVALGELLDDAVRRLG